MSFASGTNFVAYFLTATLLLVAIVTQLAASGRVRRNRFVGIRIYSTMASDAAWLAGHRAAAVPLWIGLAVTAIAAAVGQLSVVGGIPCVVAFVLSLTWSVIAASRGARKV